jgi:spore coat polysaccharide biosynthesis protein SpsF (cytidylyltransferase family)
MDKTVIIIPARSQSNRLPYKVFLPFNGETIIEHIYRQASTAYETWVAVPYDDHQLIRFMAGRGMWLFTGAKTDVLDRVYQCATNVGADHIVRITQDCPLITPSIIQETVDAYLAHMNDDTGIDYVANRLTDPMYPDGFDVEIFSYESLQDADRSETPTDEDREHVSPWIKRNYFARSVKCPDSLLPWRDIKLSIDTEEDYDRVVTWWEENRRWLK